MPARYCFRPHQDQNLGPPGPDGPKGYPEERIEPAPCRSGILTLQHQHLPAQGRNFQRPVLSGPKERAGPPQHAHDEAKHEPSLQHPRSDQASRLSVQAVDFATPFIFGHAQFRRVPPAPARAPGKASPETGRRAALLSESPRVWPCRCPRRFAGCDRREGTRNSEFAP